MKQEMIMQQEPTKHTPIPWEVGDSGEGLWWITGPDKNENVICDIIPRGKPKDVNPEDEANARFMVRCVNNHDALVEALQNIVGRGGRRECEKYSTGIGSCFKQGRRVDAQFAAEKCCAPCIADAALASAQTE